MTDEIKDKVLEQASASQERPINEWQSSGFGRVALHAWMIHICEEHAEILSLFSDSISLLLLFRYIRIIY